MLQQTAEKVFHRFEIQYSFSELIWAIRNNKPIAIIRDKAFKLKDSVPTEWRDLSALLTGPATLVYTPFYAAECAIELMSLSKQQQQKRIITADSSKIVFLIFY